MPHLTDEHLYITVFAVAIAALVALPLALGLGHRGRGGGFTVVLANVSRAVPTLALLTFFSVTPIGFGNRATIIALAVFAIPPMLTNTYVGIREVDRDVVEAARGMGMSESQVLFRVELPLAVPLITAGFRTAAVQVVATATLAALVGGGGTRRHHQLRVRPAGPRRRSSPAASWWPRSRWSPSWCWPSCSAR